MDPNTDSERLFAIVEAVRQEVWRVATGVEAAAAADRARDEALVREVAAVASSAAAVLMAVQGAVEEERVRVADELRWEERLWSIGELVLMYCGTARAMAAMGLASYVFGGVGSLAGRMVAFFLALLLDVGVVTLVGVPRLGQVGWLGRLGGCWRRWWWPARQEDVAERAGVGGGMWGWVSGRWWARPQNPNAAAQVDSPV
jgi:hypothetical protein